MSSCPLLKTTPISGYSAAFRRLVASFVLCLGLFGAAHGQSPNARSDGTVLSRNGLPSPGASVSVCQQPVSATTTPPYCSNLAALCSSSTDAVCTSPNPVTADSLGNYFFYTAPGTYTLNFYNSGLTPRTQPDQVVGASPEKIRYADQFSGADACVKIAAAIANVPSTGGTVDARSFEGTQTCSVNPFAANTKPLHLILGATTYNAAVQWNTGGVSHVHVDGLGDTSLISALNGTFPNSTAVVNMGDGATPVFDTQFNNLKVKCNGITGCSAMTASGLNELSGGENLNLDGWMVNGLKVDGSGVITEHFLFHNLTMGEQSTATGGEGIVINATGAGGVIDTASIVPHGGAATQTSGVHVEGTGANGVIALKNIHCEIRTDCVYFDTGTYGRVEGVDLTTGTNVLHVNTTGQIYASQIIVSGGVVTNTVKDDNSGVVCTDSEIPLYVKNRSNGVQASLFTGNLSTCGGLFGAAPRFQIEANTNSGTNARTAINFWNLQRDGMRIEEDADGTANNPICFRPFLLGVVGSNVWCMDGTGKITTYNSIATVSNGVPSEVATVDLTAQTAAVTTTTLYAVPSTGAGQYLLTWDSKVTTAAGTSSTIGGMTIVYTDPDGVAVTITAPAVLQGGTVNTSNNANTTQTVLLGVPLTLNCKASTNITYAFAYASNAANAMNYNLHLKLDAK